MKWCFSVALALHLLLALVLLSNFTGAVSYNGAMGPINSYLIASSAPAVVPKLFKSSATTRQHHQRVQQDRVHAAMAATLTAASGTANTSDNLTQLATILYGLIQEQLAQLPRATLDQDRAILVSFYLLPNGQITKLQLLTSSKIASLDAAIIQAINALSPIAAATSLLKTAEVFQLPVKIARLH